MRDFNMRDQEVNEIKSEAPFCQAGEVMHSQCLSLAYCKRGLP